MSKYKFQNLDFSDALSRNLGRDVLTQGRRLGVYAGGPNNLCYQALQGLVPTIHDPIVIGQPDEDGTVPFIVQGYGRTVSVLEWQGKTPLERIKDALAAALPEGKASEIKLTPGEIKALESIDGIAEMSVFLKANRPDDWGTPEEVIAAFSSDVVAPITVFDGDESEARDVAWADVAIDEATLADKLERYVFLREQGKRPSVIADDIRVAVSRVSHFKSYVDATLGLLQRSIVRKDDDGEEEKITVACRVHPAMDAVIRAHMAGLGGTAKPQGLPPSNRSASFDRLGADTHLGYLGKGQGVKEVKQLAILADVWQESNPKAKTTVTVDQLDAWASNGQRDKLIEFATELDGAALTKRIATVVAEEKMRQLQETDPEAAERERERAEAPDTPQPKAPSIAHVRAMFSQDRWAENVPHPYAEVFSAIGLFLCGHTDAESFLRESAEIKKGRGKYADDSAKVPSELGEPIKTYSEVVEAEQKAAEKAAKKAEAEARKAEAAKAADSE